MANPYHRKKGVAGGRFTSKDQPGGEQIGKSERARRAHHMVDKNIQRYAEEHNEPAFARSIGGASFRDNEPVDVVVAENGRIAHGIELKTLIDNKAAKITMKGDALARKRSWTRRNKAAFHTIVLDDTKVFNARGPGLHDLSQRVILYRRGAGSFRLANMYRCKDVAEVKSLMKMPARKLPAGAK